MINDLKDYFQKKPYAFVLLFGSYAKGDAHTMSDVDIGVWCRGEVDFMEIGYDTAMLEGVLGKRVQVVALNDLYKKDPLFAFEILASHVPVVINDRKLYDDFKREAQLYYLDHLPLIEQNREALRKRIESGKVGE